MSPEQRWRVRIEDILEAVQQDLRWLVAWVRSELAEELAKRT